MWAIENPNAIINGDIKRKSSLFKWSSERKIFFGAPYTHDPKLATFCLD